MKFTYLAVPALMLVASCSWTQKQTQSAMNWADRNMPTYDAKPTDTASNNGGLIPNQYNGYPYNGAARAPLSAPGVSAAATPPLPGMQAYSSNGLTPAQSASSLEGGNSRPVQQLHATTSKPPVGGNTYVVGEPNPALSPAQASPAAGRRVPAGMLPPSAIQPVPYGKQQPQAKAANAKGDDFPTEYNAQPSFDPRDTQIPAPPI